MDILITHGRMARTHSFHLETWQSVSMLMVLGLLLLALSGPLYRNVVQKVLPDSWLEDSVSSLGGEGLRGDAAQRDRFMRENLDAMARKVGEMQARLVRLEAIGSRVSSLAGIKPEELRAMDAALPASATTRPAPAASAASAPNRGAQAEAVGGAGGPFIPADSPSMQQLTDLVSQMETEADHRSDVFMLVESRLLEHRLASLVVPSIAPVDGPVGSGFGFRIDPINGRAALHTGLDFPAHVGTTINSAAGGVVRGIENDPAYGLLLEIDHGNGLTTRYAHNSKVLVKPGDLVRRGQPVALVGNTGRSTGAHLHFEVLLDGVPQNPQRFLAARNDNLAATPQDPRTGPRDKGRRVKAR
ncbi:MAG: hypothetical protein RJA44_632 [Pseudomonadota bacterium]|jgi:murein DD-endopeptidase MepM/ murein hydrolase activator NlpD